MFDNNDERYGATDDRFDRPEQPAGGSYYSPRSGYGNDYGMPSGGDEPPKKKSHKGLKALGVFAAIAFLSYASIQCYQFATENESIRKFLDKSASTVEAQSSINAEPPVTQPPEDSAQTPESKPAEQVSWIELASRENAMSIPDIVDKVKPATVGVASTFVYQQQIYDIWGFGRPQTQTKEVQSVGTGIIMSSDGYIVTNAHVIFDSNESTQMGLAKEVQVVLNDEYYTGETQLEATVVGYDVAEDIAVLKVNTNQNLSVAEFGDSDELRVGELVIAIGNPLGFDLFGSVTTGIVSNLNRQVTINDVTLNMIQTDTAINHGNSGGPLINSCGQVIGINSAKFSDSETEGLCFAIPVSHAQLIVNDLINYGYVTGKPMMGISGIDVKEEISQAYGLPVGVYVQSVSEGGAADLAGIRKGDVIIAIDGETIANYDELNAAKDKHKAGETITVTVTRNGEDIDFTLLLQEKKPTDDQ